jgi:hypothetical protein
VPKSKQQSGHATAEQDGLSKLMSVLESLRLGPQLSDPQNALIAEYEDIKQRLAGPTFSAPPPQITGLDTDNGKVKIYGKHLRDVRVLRIAGARVTRDHFQWKDQAQLERGDKPHIEADVPAEAGTGPITVFTSGGSATSPAELSVKGSRGRVQSTLHDPAPDSG